MAFYDLAVYVYLTLLLLGLAPIVLSWVLRRIAGKHAPTYQTGYSADEIAWQQEIAQMEREDADTDWWFFWSDRDDRT